MKPWQKKFTYSALLVLSLIETHAKAQAQICDLRRHEVQSAVQTAVGEYVLRTLLLPSIEVAEGQGVYAAGDGSPSSRAEYDPRKQSLSLSASFRTQDGGRPELRSSLIDDRSGEFSRLELTVIERGEARGRNAGDPEELRKCNFRFINSAHAGARQSKVFLVDYSGGSTRSFGAAENFTSFDLSVFVTPLYR